MSPLRSQTFRVEEAGELPRFPGQFIVRDFATVAFMAAPSLTTVRAEEILPGYWRIIVAPDAVELVRAAMAQYVPIGSVESVAAEPPGQ